MFLGAGVRNCSDGAEGIHAKILYTSPEEAAAQTMDWGVHGAARQDVKQADVSPLLASLLGVGIPMNSRGIVNLDFIGGPEPSRVRAFMIDANIRQLLELLRYTAAVVSDRHVLFRPYYEAALPDPGDALRQMQSCLAAADYDCAVRRGTHGTELTLYVVKALRYYQTYEWPLLRVVLRPVHRRDDLVGVADRARGRLRLQSPHRGDYLSVFGVGMRVARASAYCLRGS